MKDLSPEQKHAAEVLLGHPISADQTISINSLDVSSIIPSTLSPAGRIAALRLLEERFASSQTPEVSKEEEEQLVKEAFAVTHAGRRQSR